jgi:hypothetical protein
VGGFDGVKLERKNDGVHPQDQHLQLAHAANELQSTCRDLLDSVKHYQTVTEGMSAEDRFRQVYRLDKAPETQIDERDTYQIETFEQQTRFLKEFAPLFKKEKEELESNLLVGVSHENLVATTVEVNKGTAAVLIKVAQGNGGIVSMQIQSGQGWKGKKQDISVKEISVRGKRWPQSKATPSVYTTSNRFNRSFPKGIYTIDKDTNAYKLTDEEFSLKAHKMIREIEELFQKKEELTATLKGILSGMKEKTYPKQFRVMDPTVDKVNRFYAISKIIDGDIYGGGDYSCEHGVYGELTQGSVDKIFVYLRQKCNLTSTKTFCDLGGGVGKPASLLNSLVSWAAMFRAHTLSICHVVVACRLSSLQTAAKLLAGLLVPVDG